jgi:hypothetical protein
MLKETLTSPAMPIVLDLRELDFLNSSGITMLSRFVMEARDRPGIDVQVLAFETVPWACPLLKESSKAHAYSEYSSDLSYLGVLFVSSVNQFLNRQMGFPGLNLPLPAPSFRQDRVIL